MGGKATTSRLARFREKISSRIEVLPASLSHSDCQFIFDILTMRTALLIDLCGSNQVKTFTSWERTILGLKALDVELYARDWKTLRNAFTSLFSSNGNSIDTEVSTWTFKQSNCAGIHYKWILNSAIDLIEQGCSWFTLNQWIVFDEKVNLDSLDLSTDGCVKYLDFQHQPECIDESIVNALHYLFLDHYGSTSLNDYPFRPKHGSGATVEVKRSLASPHTKNRYFKYDSDIIWYLRWRCGCWNWRDYLYLPYKGLKRVSHAEFVPKSMTKNRLISKEPTTLQFLQQDLFQFFLDFFDCHPELGIQLRNQELNRDLARKASSDGSYATIDLSSASDSVSAVLVDKITQGTDLNYALMSTRSQAVLVRDRSRSISECVEQKSFAPMGSATCFPVESLVFSLCCELAVWRITGHKPRHNDYQVYGDDIIIRSEFAIELVDILQCLGFEVNKEKTFGLMNSPGFRESCGIECLFGKDISPLRLSRRLKGFTENDDARRPGYAVGHADLLNRAYRFGYRNLRRICGYWLRSQFWYKACLRSSSDDQSIRSTPWLLCDLETDSNYRALGYRKANASRYWVREYRVPVASVYQPHAHHDDNDYYTWCLQSVRKEGVQEIPSIAPAYERPRYHRWRVKWVLSNR